MAFAQVEATTDPLLDYVLCLHTKKALDADGKLSLIPHFLETLEPLSGLSEKALQAFCKGMLK
jgi:hypothetical protein